MGIRAFGVIFFLFSGVVWGAISPPTNTVMVSQDRRTPTFIEVVITELHSSFKPFRLVIQDRLKAMASAYTPSGRAFFALTATRDLVFIDPNASNYFKYLATNIRTLHRTGTAQILVAGPANELTFWDIHGNSMTALKAGALSETVYGKIVKIQKIDEDIYTSAEEYVFLTDTHLIKATLSPRTGVTVDFCERLTKLRGGMIQNVHDMVATRKGVWLFTSEFAGAPGLQPDQWLVPLEVTFNFVERNAIKTTLDLQMLEVDAVDSSLLARAGDDYIRADAIAGTIKVEALRFFALPSLTGWGHATRSNLLVEQPRTSKPWNVWPSSRIWGAGAPPPAPGAVGVAVVKSLDAAKVKREPRPLNEKADFRQAFKLSAKRLGIPDLPERETVLKFVDRVNGSDSLRYIFKDVPAADLKVYGFAYRLGDLVPLEGHGDDVIVTEAMLSLMSAAAKKACGSALGG